MPNAFHNKYFDQIVIGNGSSALNFIHSAREGSNEKLQSDKTLVIGKSDLWSRTNGNHAMGQPAVLLQRQLGNNRYPYVSEKPRPTGLDKTKGEYLTAGEYTAHLEGLRKKLQAQGGVNFVNETVAAGGISETGNSFKVLDGSGNSYFAKSVIIASGIGPAATLDVWNGALTKLKGSPLDYEEIVDAVTYYNSKQPPGLTVLVYGGSATASWAANHAWMMKAKHLRWLCRRGISQISTEGNPVGRNSAVIQMAVKNNLIWTGEITEVIANLGVNRGEPRLRVKMTCPVFDAYNYFFDKNGIKRARELKLDSTDKDGKKLPIPVPRVKKDDKGRDLSEQHTFYVHQLVYAVGSNPLGPEGPGNILAASLLSQLEPVYAKDYQFMTAKNDDILLAYSNKKGNLWVVGAAVFGGLGVDKLAKLKAKYSKVGDFLPRAGTPPEGIAILSTTIDALTGRMETDPAKFDWNRARPEEIVNLFVTKVKVARPVAEAITDVLVTIRSDRKFVLTHGAIRNAIADFDKTRAPMHPESWIDVKRLQLQ